MPTTRLPLQVLLRATLLAMLVLGVMVRPTLNLVGELHAVQHAALAAAGDLDHQDDGEEHDESGHHDGDHAQGSHGLLHQADAGTAASIWTSVTAMPTIPPSSLMVMSRYAELPPQSIGSPFRPPIA